MARGQQSRSQRGGGGGGKTNGQLSDADAESAINRKLAESGERDRLRERLVDRLSSTGWREQIKSQVNDYVNDVG